MKNKKLSLLPKQDVQKPAGELRREARLARIAGALASGASITDIAAIEGISRVIASREANSSKCRQLIATNPESTDASKLAMLRACLIRLLSDRSRTYARVGKGGASGCAEGAKHAFPGNRTGRVTISIAASEDEAFLSMMDTGVGTPANPELRRSGSLGLRLIHMMASQLQGTVTLHAAQGTKVEIRFPLLAEV